MNYGEAPERGWSDANGVASSTKEMGPGSRRNTLDDHFGDRNWAKIAKFGETFVQKCEEAIEGREEYINAFIEFDAALPEESTKAWTQLCQAWEADPGSQTHSSGQNPVWSSKAFNLGPHSTSLQNAKILERSNSLRRKFEAWIDIQHLYFPFIAILRGRADQQGGGKPLSVQNIELHLPSSLVGKQVFPMDILRTEWRLRLTHTEESLNDLRGLLLMQSMMQKSKDQHMHGQRQQTRSRGILNGVEERIRAAAAKYRRIREALSQLASPLQERSWETLFLPLDLADAVSHFHGGYNKKEVRKNLGTNKSEGKEIILDMEVKTKEQILAEDWAKKASNLESSPLHQASWKPTREGKIAFAYRGEHTQADVG
ncbi:hypothetical protein B0H34DRAFT_680129 [Crassisporium funariophilum]|nr:hypothetical protein B0H34DRAFT_680129 [Crassisporium funariophilum]